MGTAEADRDVVQATDQVEFFHGAAAMRKKAAVEADPFTRRRELVEATNQAEVWATFALFLLRRGRNKHEAVRCARRAVESEPMQAAHYFQLSITLEAIGDFAGAIEAVQQAVAIDATFAAFNKRLATLKARAT